jgi:hypothetical protein
MRRSAWTSIPGSRRACWRVPERSCAWGLAELVEDAQLVREITDRILLRYIGPEAPQFEEAVWFEGRTGVILTPVRWLTWDQSKG